MQRGPVDRSSLVPENCSYGTVHAHSSGSLHSSGKLREAPGKRTAPTSICLARVPPPKSPAKNDLEKFGRGGKGQFPPLDGRALSKYSGRRAKDLPPTR